jgi:hypothetical protein
MSGLSPELREFVQVSRSALRPTEADAGRILEALRAQLGDAAVLGAQSAQAAVSSASTSFLFGKGSLLSLVGLAMLGGIWFYAAHNPRAALRETDAIASVGTTASATIALAPSLSTSSATLGPEPAASEVAAVANLGSDGDKLRPAASHHVHDRLAEEVAIIARAETALRSGHPAVALDVLNEHERKFGNGLLAEERIAARAQALCALGRTAEAQVQLTQLSPNSLHGQPSRKACGSQKSN